MSYDLALGVKVAELDNVFAEIATPEYDQPTYNLGKMFRKATGWDFNQGEWYRCEEVLPKIQHGISELKFHRSAYKKYDAPNGWGTTDSALQTLESLEDCIMRTCAEGEGYTDVPLSHLWVKW